MVVWLVIYCIGIQWNPLWKPPLTHIVVCLPLQAVSGSGSLWRRPSKCCRATNLSTPSICGDSSSTAPLPTVTPSSRAHHPTTTTPTTVPPPPPPRRAACWAPPADRTASQALDSAQHREFTESLYSLAWISWLLWAAALLYVQFLVMDDRTHQSHQQERVERLIKERQKSDGMWMWIFFPRQALDWWAALQRTLLVWRTWWRNALPKLCMNVVSGSFYFISTVIFICFLAEWICFLVNKRCM